MKSMMTDNNYLLFLSDRLSSASHNKIKEFICRQYYNGLQTTVDAL